MGISPETNERYIKKLLEGFLIISYIPGEEVPVAVGLGESSIEEIMIEEVFLIAGEDGVSVGLGINICNDLQLVTVMRVETFLLLAKEQNTE